MAVFLVPLLQVMKERPKEVSYPTQCHPANQREGRDLGLSPPIRGAAHREGQQRHRCPSNAALLPGTAASAADKLHLYMLTEPTSTCHLQDELACWGEERDEEKRLLPLRDAILI